MTKTDLLNRVQRVQDLLSEHFNVYLGLVDEKGSEVTLPSGLPLACYERMLEENSKCHGCLNELLQKYKEAKRTVTIRCPYGFYVNISSTRVFLSTNKSPVYLICGKTTDSLALETHFKLINGIFSLPLGALKTDSSKPAGTKSSSRLTQREMAILNLIADGLTNKEISSHLCISLSTVKSHIANIFKKIDVSNRTEAALVFKTIKDSD